MRTANALLALILLIVEVFDDDIARAGFFFQKEHSGAQQLVIRGNILRPDDKKLSCVHVSTS
jgi:hypothetical protein